jgi:hypothetical protein
MACLYFLDIWIFEAPKFLASSRLDSFGKAKIVLVVLWKMRQLNGLDFLPSMRRRSSDESQSLDYVVHKYDRCSVLHIILASSNFFYSVFKEKDNGGEAKCEGEVSDSQ